MSGRTEVALVVGCVGGLMLWTALDPEAVVLAMALGFFGGLLAALCIGLNGEADAAVSVLVPGLVLLVVGLSVSGFLSEAWSVMWLPVAIYGFFGGAFWATSLLETWLERRMER